MEKRTRLALGCSMSFAACVALLADTPTARACGCLSPPAVTEGEFAVNQRAEQIIFEVEPGWVTAHVLIKYAGDPAKFAWIVPVPEVPELAISPLTAFGLLDRATAPSVTAAIEDVCPISEYQCAFAPISSCGLGGDDGRPGHRDRREGRRRLPHRHVPRERGGGRDAVAARQRLRRQQHDVD